MVHSFHGDVARTQQLRRAVAHFQLKLGVVAEGGQVVRGEGVPQDVRLPVDETGFSVQACSETTPVRRANPLVPGTLDALQDTCQGPEDGDMSCAAGLAVARGGADDAIIKPHIVPAQPLHFVRAHARVEHDGCGGETGAVLEGLGGVHESPDFLFVQDVDALFFNAFRFHFAHRVFRAPASLARRGEDPAEDEPRLVPLPWRVESLLDVLFAFLGGDAAHAPIRQPLAPSHEPFRDAAEVAQRPFPSVLPRLQCLFNRPCKGDRLFAPPQFFLPRLNARHGALHASPPRFQRSFRHQRSFQYIHPRLPQHLYRRQLRLSVRFRLHCDTYLESVRKKNMTAQQKFPDIHLESFFRKKR